MIAQIGYIAVSLITGFAVGWLVTLSGSWSTLAGTLIAAAITALGVLYASMAAYRVAKDSQTPNPVVVCAVAIGLALGVPAALRAKADDWFEPRPSAVRRHWSATGLNDSAIATLLFNKAHPTDTTARR
jgi:hypothetical protein